MVNYFTGMTMVKLGKGEENNPVDFINKRRAALERYSTRYVMQSVS